MKKIMILISISFLLFLIPGVKADSYPASPTDWQVTFNGKELTSNYDEASVAAALRGMQPGDEATLVFTLKNDHDTAVDWYMENTILKSLEDESGTAKGGAYTYELTYKDTSGKEEDLYNSKAVGGEKEVNEKKVGLHEATDALDEYFFLESIGPGKTAVVTLHIVLNGETQANNYQDTLAKLRLKFAVEIPTAEPEHRQRIIMVPNTSAGHRGGGMSFFLPDLTAAAAVILGLYLFFTRKKKEEVQG